VTPFLGDKAVGLGGKFGERVRGQGRRDKAERKKFCEELIAYFPSMRYGWEEKTRYLGDEQTAASPYDTTSVSSRIRNKNQTPWL
jgi:hypothetical protein